MKSINTNKRRIMIAVITTLFLILFSLWMITKATEDVEDTENMDKTSESNQYYTPYRNNILGVAGDFCVFTYEKAELSEVTADIAVGGDFTAGSFGNYKTKWEFYEKNDLKFVNLNSYVRGKYNGGTYSWVANKCREDLTCNNGEVKGTYDEENNNGKANLYIYTGQEKNQIGEAASNQCNINGNCYENTPCNDDICNKPYKSYNVIGVNYEFINFEKEFENLSNVSETLMNAGEQIELECIPKEGKVFTYEFPKNQSTVLIKVNSENFFKTDNCDTFNINGLDSSKKIVINVDCSGLTECPITPRIQVNGSAEDWNCLAENILFNFYNASSEEIEQIEAKEIIGTILAPNLEVYINGNLDGSVISRKVKTTNAIYGINSDIGWDDINGKIEETSVSVEKVWVDAEDKDKVRPNEIKLQLLADNEEIGIITLGKDNKATIKQTKKEEQKLNGNSKIEASGTTDNGKWSCKITKLPKYKEDGKTEIEYTIKEIEINENYEAKVEKMEKDNEEETKELKYKITNTLLTEIQGEKIWDDDNNNDGYRPDKVEVTLYRKDANGKEIKVEDIKNPITVKASQETDKNKWSYKFAKVKKYDEDGKEIAYVVKEKITDKEVSEKYKAEINKFTITNKHELEKTSIKVTKKWDDDNDRDGIRPNEVKVTLKSDVEEIKEQTVKLSEENNWTYTFKNLQKYKNGQEIQYKVEEDDVQGYTSEMKDKYTITNTHKPATINISGTKTWVDENNQDKIRPDSVTVRLFADGKEVEGQEKVVTKENNWKYTFENLPKKASGKDITYSVKEDYVAGYKATVDDNYNITNTHELGKTDVSGMKTWVDDENKGKTRPDSIVVNLLADGEVIDSKNVTSNDGWKYSFENLDMYKNGKKIIYTVDEEQVKGYTKKINGFNITNTLIENNKMTINGTKTWIDREYEDARPEKIKINLLANGEVVQTKEVTAEDNWEYEFKDLDIYENGKKIEYTISEEELDEYETIIDGYNITNRHILVAGDEAIDIKVTKKWIDEGNEDLRPDSITVKLLSNGEVIRTQEITKEEKWEHTFKQLPKYDKEGNEIEYTVTENAISGYETSINEFEITNTYIHPVISDKFVIKINKYEKGTTKKLEGAKFAIVIKDEDGKEVLNNTKNTNSEGQIVLKDLELENGTYTIEIKETKAPKEYKKLEDAIKIEFTVKEKDGKKVVELKEKYKNVEVEKTTMTIKVENTKEQKKDNTTSGNKLPQTGPGNMIIASIVVVGFLVVGAIGIFKYREVKF